MNRRNKLTPEQWEQIIEARKSGATIKEMIQRFEISYSVACEVARNYDAYPAQYAKRCVYPNIARWLVDNGMNKKAFMNATGLSRNAMRELMSGVTKQPTPQTVQAILTVTGLDRDEAFAR